MRPAQRKTESAGADKYKMGHHVGHPTVDCFTLVEVVVASLLLAVAMVPILRALAASHVLDRTIEYRMQSLILARGELDRIKAESIYNFDTDFTRDSSAAGEGYLISVDDNGVVPPSDDLRQISVSAGYDSNHNLKLEDDEVGVTLRTFIARRWD